MNESTIETRVYADGVSATGTPPLPELPHLQQDETARGLDYRWGDNRPKVWLDHGRIITRNADGGTTAWSEEDAATLHRSLGEILAAINWQR